MNKSFILKWPRDFHVKVGAILWANVWKKCNIFSVQPHKKLSKMKKGIVQNLDFSFQLTKIKQQQVSEILCHVEHLHQYILKDVFHIVRVVINTAMTVNF